MEYKLILRYPGGKKKIAKVIVRIIKSWLDTTAGDVEYCEPFFGGGAVGFGVIKECPGFSRYWLNDGDPAMACLWRSIVERADSLRILLGCFEPSVGYFKFYKKLLRKINSPEDLDGHDPVSVSLMKISLHQMSYSGLGTMAGGPIGGVEQTGTNDVGCRYDGERIAKSVYSARDLLTSVPLHPDICTCVDFENTFAAGGDGIYYADPPYYKAGPGLYQAAFKPEDHVRLAETLRAEDRPWLLSYDRHPVIEDLYSGWASVREIPIGYSINRPVRSSEWLISNRSFEF
jgi:DNA adenine methylase